MQTETRRYCYIVSWVTVCVCVCVCAVTPTTTTAGSHTLATAAAEAAALALATTQALTPAAHANAAATAAVQAATALADATAEVPSLSRNAVVPPAGPPLDPAALTGTLPAAPPQSDAAQGSPSSLKSLLLCSACTPTVYEALRYMRP